ncbi:MAG: hypothetical protein WDZ29_01730 [Balneolaceae bacterium]
MKLPGTDSGLFLYRIHPLLARMPGYAAMLLRRKSPLREWGWFRSFRTGRSIDGEGRPLPWMTYGAIRLLDERLSGVKNLNVFEYGSGYGTLWWADRASRLQAVEHQQEWAEELHPKLRGSDAELKLRPREQEYIGAVKESGLRYDVVVVDGLERVRCAEVAVECLSERGVLIWDDSEREKYQKGIVALQAKGFRRLSFYGFSPVEFMACETSIFYRDGNVLGV